MALFAVFDSANVCNSFLIRAILFLKNSENVQGLSFLSAFLLWKEGVLLNSHTQSRSLMIPSEMKIPALEKRNLSPFFSNSPLSMGGFACFWQYKNSFSPNFVRISWREIPHIVRSPVMIKSLYRVYRSKSSDSIAGRFSAIPFI